MDPSYRYNTLWTREFQWDNAMLTVERALTFWKLPTVEVIPTAPPLGRRFSTGGTFFGLWRPPNKIWVNVSKSTRPARVKGRVWSWPGYKVDRTCSGILAHEVGHHVAAHVTMDAMAWRKILTVSKPVTGYEPVASESWAESFRVFFWNPDLLKQGRPARYDYIRQYFEPLHNQNWYEVLSNAPLFIKIQAEKFTLEGKLKRSLI